MKKCSKCKIEKEFIEFNKAKKAKDGLQPLCRTCCNKYHKKYRDSNKDYFIKKSKKYRDSNKDYFSKYKKKWEKEKRHTNPLFKLKCKLRGRTCSAFKAKGYKKDSMTSEMLGVDWEVCKAHIERQFTKGMSWDNSAEWHIDHIIPLASANTEEELKKLCHYSNLQPLWAFDNLIKSAKINGQQNKFRF